jgi:hypothetical protein
MVTTHVVVLTTTSKGSIRILFIGLFPEDRQEIKELVESRFGMEEKGAQDTDKENDCTQRDPGSEGLRLTKTDRNGGHPSELHITHSASPVQGPPTDENG